MKVKDRVSKLIKLLEPKDVSTVILFDPKNIQYFSGFNTLGGSAVLINNSNVILYIPPLEYERALNEKFDDVEVKVYSTYKTSFDIGTSKITYKNLLDAIIDDVKEESSNSRVGLELATLPYNTTLKISKTLNVELIDVTNSIYGLREVKDTHEVDSIVKAVKIAEEAFNATFQRLNADLRELDVAAMLEYEMKIRGSVEPAFSTIVASGRNTSQPHAKPTFKRIGLNEPIIVDFGAKYQGYCSDITRTFIIGRVNEELFKDVFHAVLEAQRETIKNIKPDIKASTIDGIARKVLQEYNLSQYFIHTLGHGVGLSVHERPKISPDATDKLKPGMVFTVEPGVYIKGKFGVRIEDLVLVTEHGCKVLTTISRELV